MNTGYIIGELARNREVYRNLLEGLPSELYSWKPQPEKWCLLEIVCHLYDEEREDFRTRVRQTLEKPGTTPPPIDPVGWVSQRQYFEQDYDSMLRQFLDERATSVRWLQQLTAPQWDNHYEHPKLGALSAKLFFTNWLAHDYLHFRQITRLKYDYLRQTTGESLAYAGTW